MSTDYITIPQFRFADLFDGRLKKHGVREKIRDDTTETDRYLEGSDGVLSASRTEGGYSLFQREAFSSIPRDVIDALTKEFEVDVVSEHNPRYWGFETAEEWSAHEQKLSGGAQRSILRPPASPSPRRTARSGP
jgi:hypothetical protein